MKVRSKRLFAFLEARGLLDGTEAEITAAKRAFRKQYKKDWKQYRRVKKRELCCLFTPEEYEAIRNEAKRIGLRPSTYGREVILASENNRLLIPHRPELLKVLQLVGITGIALAKAREPLPSYLLTDSATHLQQAEHILLTIINQKH